MRRPWAWLLALGGVLVVAGVVLFALANSHSVDFGWTAYTPLEPGDSAAYQSEFLVTFADGSLVWTRQHAVGAGVTVLGLLVLVGTGGWLLGRRSR